MNDAEIIIHAQSITKTYNKGENSVTPLKDLDLQVCKGEFVSLMGPLSVGKYIYGSKAIPPIKKSMPKTSRKLF